jgi:Na+-translocating ferredoxin:NAD+ oxidoreductase RnfD subunit
MLQRTASRTAEPTVRTAGPTAPRTVEPTVPPGAEPTVPPGARSGAADPRITALRRFAISITVFNIVGHLFLGFEQAYLTPVVGLLTGYVVSLVLETVDAWARGRQPRYRGSARTFVNFLLPAHIAGLACAMLLYGNESLWPTVFAVTVAVASKYLVRVRVGGALRHVLNPSNFGISVTLLCFTWVSIAPPYQFTEFVRGPLDWLIPLAVLASGTMLNAKLTHRVPLILGWVGGFVLQAVIRALFFHDSLVSILLVMAGVAFILYTNYMITDPGTTPTAPRNQVIFGLLTALTYGALVVAHIAFGLFFALVIVCVGRLLWTLVSQRLRAARPAGSEPSAAVRPAPQPAVAASGQAS